MKTSDAKAVGAATRPPARYTEATLLTAMEGAGKLIEDDDLRLAMAGKGLGTPATRSAIIEGLLDQRYIVRDGKDLRPTRKAFDLMTLLKGLDVQELTAPELTGEWEYKLSQMERGKLKRDLFMKEIAGMTSKIVERAKSYQSDTVPIDDPATLKTPCPKCGGVVSENYRRFACGACDFSIGKHPGSRTLEVEEVEQLLGDRTIGPLQGFISKMGRPFAAVLKITPEFKLEFDFGQANADDGSDEPVDFSAQTPVGRLPEVRRARVRAAHGVRLREERRAGAVLRLPVRQGDPAAADRARADGEAAGRGPHGRPARLHLEPDAAQVLGLPGEEARRRDRLRVRTARAARRQGRTQDREGGRACPAVEAPAKQAAKRSVKAAPADGPATPAKSAAKRPAKAAKRAATKTAARKTTAKKAAKAGAAGARKAPARD